MQVGETELGLWKKDGFKLKKIKIKTLGLLLQTLQTTEIHCNTYSEHIYHLSTFILKLSHSN